MAGSLQQPKWLLAGWSALERDAPTFAAEPEHNDGMAFPCFSVFSIVTEHTLMFKTSDTARGRYTNAQGRGRGSAAAQEFLGGGCATEVSN